MGPSLHVPMGRQRAKSACHSLMAKSKRKNTVALESREGREPVYANKVHEGSCGIDALLLFSLMKKVIKKIKALNLRRSNQFLNSK
jgi:hypothetical protein